ncbi:MAG: PD-(D/E)XK nuclease family protein [Clostridia bacterium]|nr:PD-(D/E)XK nuclease family protein [Clostridia bacterium]
MLNIICGKSGSGKTELIYRNIKSDIENGKKVYLIVPEQQSVITEKQIVSLCSNKCNMYLEVLNFTRLCNRVFREYGGMSQKYIDNGGKILILDTVLEELGDSLERYSDKSGTEFLSRLMAQLENIERRGAIGDLNRLLLSDDNCGFDDILKGKLRDLSLIYLSYKNKLHENYSDPADDIQRLCETLDEFSFFENTNVYIDGFYEFCAGEYNVIRRIINQADNVYVSLIRGFDVRDESFIIGDTTFNKLKQMSPECHVIKCENDFRTRTEALKYLKEFLFDDFASSSCQTDGVEITECRNIYEECAATAHKISQIIKSEKIHYSDISVAVRNPDKYRGIIDMYFEKYNIPFLFSSREDITLKPLFSFVFACLECICDSFSKESVQKYLKSGFSCLSSEEIYLLESYIITHNIKGKSTWEKTWTVNPEGYGVAFTDKLKRTLEKINELRERVFEPLCQMSESMKRQNVRERCTALYEFLSRREILDTINSRCEKLRQKGDYASADQNITVWNILMNCLDQMVIIMGERKVSTQKFCEILKLLCSNYSSAIIPSAIDQVNIGEAGHMRCNNVKHTFILGLCENEFPGVCDGGALLTEKEVRIINEAGIDAGETGEFASCRERMFFYIEASRPSECLHLLYNKTDMSGSERTESSFLLRVKSLLPGVKMYCFDLNKAFPVNKEEAFDYLLDNYGKCPEKFEQLYSYFKNHPDYKNKLLYLESASENLNTPKKLSPGFFRDKNIYMSQSSFEKYINCPYSYYVSNLLGAKPEKSVKIDYSIVGTFVHGILERFMNRTGDAIKTASDEQIRIIAEEITEEYIKENLPEYDSETPRFKYLIRRISRIAVLSVLSLADEMRNSEFVPIMFEERIGNGAISQYEIPLEDGSKLIFKGIVDRVDLYKSADGKEYVKVVDYKTGRSAGVFSLKEVLNGFKLQMLIYLFAIKNGGLNLNGENHKVIPAGLLYIPAVRPSLKSDLLTDKNDFSEEIRNSFRRSGIVLDDKEILCAMEKNPGSVYLPLKTNRDGTFSSDGLATLEQFGILEKYIKELTSYNVNMLKKGNISVNPFTIGKKSCEFCDCLPVCRFDGTGRCYRSVKSGEEWTYLGGENSSDGE